MALEAISKLFTNRKSVHADSFDIQHGIEQFLQQELHSERIHCKVKGAAVNVDVRVGTTALAEAILIREGDVRRYVTTQLQCSLGLIRVMLEI
ncbi:MAG: hypothetical protein O3A36_01070 [bacterium]|nr:hypothetical protein [bacterium]